VAAPCAVVGGAEVDEEVAGRTGHGRREGKRRAERRSDL
jgi:hypothetical protein